MNKEQEDDDIFDQSEQAEREFQDRQYNNYTSGFKTAGYREGITTDVDEQILQEGFDTGYQHSFFLSRSFGIIKSHLAMVYTIYEENKFFTLANVDHVKVLKTLGVMQQELKELHENVLSRLISDQSEEDGDEKNNDVETFIEERMNRIKNEIREFYDRYVRFLQEIESPFHPPTYVI